MANPTPMDTPTSKAARTPPFIISETIEFRLHDDRLSESNERDRHMLSEDSSVNPRETSSGENVDPHHETPSRSRVDLHYHTLPTPPNTPRKIHPSKMDEIADLLCEFYELMADMNYVRGEDILYPPHQAVRRRLTNDEVTSKGLTTEVAELIRKVPYLAVVANNAVDIIPDTKVMMYGTYQALEESRELFSANSIDLDNLAPFVAPIWVSRRAGGTNLLFDTKTGEVVPVRLGDAARFGGKEPPRLPVFYYPNRRAIPATDYFKDLVSKFRGLEVVPWITTIIDNDDPLLPYYQHIYVISGWPKRFNKRTFQERQERFTDWLDSRDYDLGYKVNEENWDSHFDDNYKRVFTQARIRLPAEYSSAPKSRFENPPFPHERNTRANVGKNSTVTGRVKEVKIDEDGQQFGDGGLEIWDGGLESGDDEQMSEQGGRDTSEWIPSEDEFADDGQGFGNDGQEIDDDDHAFADDQEQAVIDGHESADDEHVVKQEEDDTDEWVPLEPVEQGRRDRRETLRGGTQGLWRGLLNY